MSLKLHGDGQPPQELHTAIYRVTQEALNNVVRHSGATHASVELVIDAARVRLLVQDNGCGFRARPDVPGALRPRSMRERAVEWAPSCASSPPPARGRYVVLNWGEGGSGLRPTSSLA